MDRASKGLDLRLPGAVMPGGDIPRVPVDRQSAVALVVRGDELMDESEPEKALAFYRQAAEFDERDVAAAACFGAGNALYRLDREAEAHKAWQDATEFGETPVAYRAWRQVAAALVREGDLPAALKAYRQAEKRAPREDRAEIAGRLGWLNKETGNTKAAGRYFARSRGDALPSFMTYLIIGLTVVTSFASIGMPQQPGGSMANQLFQALELNKLAVAHGEYYRLLTVVLVHDPANMTIWLLHLGFNMYALWFAGQLVERMYGSGLMLAMYALSGIGGSVATYVLGGSPDGYGASGAVFGMFGVILVSTRYHRAVLEHQWRPISAQIVGLIVMNLLLGFAGIFPVDNIAHLGGLAAGMWLAFVIVPGQVPTLAGMWQSRRESKLKTGHMTALRVVGVIGMVAVVGAGIAMGTSRWQSDPFYKIVYPAGATGHVAQPAAAVPVIARLIVRG